MKKVENSYKFVESWLLRKSEVQDVRRLYYDKVEWLNNSASNNFCS